MVDFPAPSQQLSSHTIDLDNLQQEVITLLDDVNVLIADTKADLSDSSALQYDRFQAQISAMEQNVANLELRMAIVAPMKAGKSTIINAIAGQELLPSCAVAMTTIPTEIVFNPQKQQSVLHLSKDTIDLFQDLQQQLKQKVEPTGIEPFQQRLSRYPHLFDLLAEVAASNNLALVETVAGQEAITKVLNRLNHLIRLFSVLEPTQDPLLQLKDVPRIEAPSMSLGNREQTKSLGNLTIIDTPGPNEAGGLKLSAVVEEQLRRSSIVLIVLDFTQLNSEAAETIKQQIQPIVESIGTDNLYVLVNKIDCRRQGDLTSEQIKEFVIADLGLNAERDRDRVFEIAAIRAFAATKFLLEVQQNPGTELLQIKSLTTLAQEVLGIDWDEELDDITVEILTKKARKLWHKSGFAPFFDSAIATLMENAAPQCLSNALNLSRNHLLSIRDDLNLRHQAITQDTDKLRQEITALESDLAYLESSRDRLSSIAEIKIELQQNLQILLEQLKKKAAFDMESFFVEEEYARVNALEKADIKARNLLLSNLGDFELLPIYKQEQYKKPYKKEDYYAVSVHEIIEQINSASVIFVGEIERKVTAYLEQELHQQVDDFFIKLDRYLSNYLQSLQQA